MIGKERVLHLLLKAIGIGVLHDRVNQQQISVAGTIIILNGLFFYFLKHFSVVPIL